MQLCHYLHLCDKEERKVLIRILSNEHPFALEKFRHSYSRNYKTYSILPREHRFCRLCAGATESPEHALLICTGDDRLRDMRAIFLAQAAARQPGLPDTTDAARATETLQSLLSLPSIAGELARIPRNATAGHSRGRGRGRGRG
ncbi:unnamed protein product [Peniophora sp. CBMAI 1063]|nr:unnamed protein product [Peniophora sp. CBMAI 1063]